MEFDEFLIRCRIFVYSIASLVAMCLRHLAAHEPYILSFFLSNDSLGPSYSLVLMCELYKEVSLGACEAS
jgi:hypothetical protein